MGRVLVTGGLGFIGSHLCADLLGRGDQVLVADWSRPQTLPPPLANMERSAHGRLVRCDLSNPNHTLRLLKRERFDHVVHLAGMAAEATDDAEGSTAVRVNFNSTMNVVQGCVEHQPTLKSLVIFSSDKVPVESHPAGGPGPASVRARSDILREQIVDVLRPAAPFPISTLRLSNVVGPYDPSHTRLVPRSLRRIFAARPKPPVLYTEAEGQARQFIDVTDVVAAWRLAAELDDGGSYNVEPAARLAVSEVVDLVVEIAAQEVETVSARRAAWIRENGVAIRNSAGADARQPVSPAAVETDRFTRVTGFVPRVSFDTSIRRAVRAKMGLLVPA